MNKHRFIDKNIEHLARWSHSESQIIYVNPAIYIEKLNISKPDILDEPNCKNENSTHANDITDNGPKKQVSTNTNSSQFVNRQLIDFVGNEAGDGLSVKYFYPKSENAREILPQQKEFEKNVESMQNSLRSDSLSSLKSFFSMSFDSMSKSLMSNDNEPREGQAEQLSAEEQNFYVQSENKNEQSTSETLQNCEYDMDKEFSFPKLEIPVRDVDEDSNATYPVLSSRVKYSTKLAHVDSSDTFPEKSIFKKIEKINSLKDSQLKKADSIPQNWEDLVRSEDMAWFRWYVSKLEANKQQKKVQRNESKAKIEEEKAEEEHRLQKQKSEEKALKEWTEKKKKEEEMKQKIEARKIDLETKKKKMEQVKVKKMAEKAIVEWKQRKEETQKEQKLREEKLQRKREEEKKLKHEQSKKAFEEWCIKSKNKPKPMSVAISDCRASDPVLDRLNWNPVPWQNILEDSKTSKVEHTGRKLSNKSYSSI